MAEWGRSGNAKRGEEREPTSFGKYQRQLPPLHRPGPILSALCGLREDGTNISGEKRLYLTQVTAMGNPDLHLRVNDFDFMGLTEMQLSNSAWGELRGIGQAKRWHAGCGLRVGGETAPSSYVCNSRQSPTDLLASRSGVRLVVPSDVPEDPSS